MRTKWDSITLPPSWSARDVKAVLRLRAFFQGLAQTEHGGFSGVARRLGYKRASSLDQLCDGRQKVGVSILERIHAAGYSAVSIYPEHTFAQSLANSNSTRRLHLVPLHDLEVAEQVLRQQLSGLESRKLAVVVGQHDIPAAAFLVEVPDARLAQLGIESGALLVCDPHARAPYGTRPLVVSGSQGLDIVTCVETDLNAETDIVVAAAVLKTTEAVTLD